LHHRRVLHRLAFAIGVALIAGSVPLGAPLTAIKPTPVQAACGDCPGAQVLNCAPDQQWDPSVTYGTENVNQEIPQGCPTPMGDAEAVVAEIGPASSDPIGAITAASQAGLLAVPDPNVAAQFYADQATSAASLGTASTATTSGWNYSYAAVEWCRQGYGGCNAWMIWLKGEVHWNGSQVWGDWTDCSDHSAHFSYSLSIGWCGMWNNGATYSSRPTFMDLGENWDVFCCTGSNWGSDDGYWTRIDVYPSSSHNFRGGGPD